MIWLYGALAWMALVLWGLALLRLGSRGDQDRTAESDFPSEPALSR